MSWEDILKQDADEVFEMFRPQLEERGEKKITSGKAKLIMRSYEELGNLSEDKRKEIAIYLALGPVRRF